MAGRKGLPGSDVRSWPASSVETLIHEDVGACPVDRPLQARLHHARQDAGLKHVTARSREPTIPHQETEGVGTSRQSEQRFPTADLARRAQSPHQWPILGAGQMETGGDIRRLHSLGRGHGHGVRWQAGGARKHGRKRAR